MTRIERTKRVDVRSLCMLIDFLQPLLSSLVRRGQTKYMLLIIHPPCTNVRKLSLLHNKFPVVHMDYCALSFLPLVRTQCRK